MRSPSPCFASIHFHFSTILLRKAAVCLHAFVLCRPVTAKWLIVMNMSEVITRINFLAKKAKPEGLTAEETAERDKLRRIYIDSVKANLVGQLDNTYIVRPDGTKQKLERK